MYFSTGKRFKYLPVVNVLVKDKREENKMGKIVVKKVIQRKPGHLYYVDGQGNVCEAVMARGGRKKKRR